MHYRNTYSNTCNELIVNADYYPYGMVMSGRHGNDETKYRYGFQGQEIDDEVKGEGNSVNYKYRMHDPRIGRFFAVDPLQKKYPQWTPYAFSGNQVTIYAELEGLEPTIDLNDAKEGETYQGNYNGHTYNWTVKRTLMTTDSETGEEFYKSEWVQGTVYNGPNVDEAAQLANQVYNINNGLEVGDKVGDWELMKTYNQYGEYGFKAGFFRKEVDGKYFYVFATAGTEADPVDIAADYNQTKGYPSTEYQISAKHAKRISKYMKTLKKGNSLTFVGHSLGGGLAALNSALTGHHAITFNATGLSSGTKRINEISETQLNNIDAYVVEGEVLNFLEQAIDGGADGKIHNLPRPSTYDVSPSNYGVMIGWRVTLHSMSSVIKSIEENK